MLELRPLRPEDEDAAMQAQAELALDGFTFLLDRGRAGTFTEYLQVLDRQRRGEDPDPARVPATFLVAEVDGELVGRVSIRHELNDRLRHEGGHIGFAVRPDHRRRGYATRILQLGLQRLVGLGIDEALVTCDEDNVGSATVIERCGGRYVDTVATGEGTPRHRYRARTRVAGTERTPDAPLG